MYKLSVFLPTIRPHLLEEWYKSLELSCSASFEVVFAGPFEIPEPLLRRDNVKFIKTYSHPTKSAHIAALECEGEYIYHTTDDVLFIPDSIDQSLKLLEGLRESDIVSMRYIESKNHENKESFPLHYWIVANSCPHPNLNPQWNINVHFLMKRALFLEYGGFDCIFEYLTQAGADLLIRLQNNGSKVYHSPTDATTAHWQPEEKTHKVIAEAQLGMDYPYFNNLWFSEPWRGKIDLNNYMNYPDFWTRRFQNKHPKTFEELDAQTL